MIDRIKKYTKNKKENHCEGIDIKNNIKEILFERFSEIEELNPNDIIEYFDLEVWFVEEPIQIGFRFKNLQIFESNVLTNFDLIMKEVFNAELSHFCLNAENQINFYYNLEK